MGSTSDDQAAKGLPRGTVAAMCVTAAVLGALLWTAVVYFIYCKRKQRLLKQHRRQNSLLDPTGAPRSMSGSDKQGVESKGLHQRTASKAAVLTTPMAAMTPNWEPKSHRSSHTVPPPAIPDEPIELMDKHYSQQFGKFKTVEWDSAAEGGKHRA